jgi:hypothetical protein
MRELEVRDLEMRELELEMIILEAALKCFTTLRAA